MILDLADGGGLYGWSRSVTRDPSRKRENDDLTGCKGVSAAITMIVVRAKEKGHWIDARREAERLLEEFPNCRATVGDLVDEIMGLAIGLGAGLEND
jgi:hypothetical protein